MLHELMLPLKREAVAALINDDISVAELMGWPTGERLRDSVLELIRVLLEGRQLETEGKIVFSVEIENADLIRVRSSGRRAAVAIKARVYDALMRSVGAFICELDGAADTDIPELPAFRNPR